MAVIWIQFDHNVKTTEGTGGAGEKKFEWAKIGCRNACTHISKLPTAHVNQRSYRLPIFPCPCLLTYRYLNFQLFPTGIVDSEQGDYLKEWNNKKPDQKPGAEAGMRQVLCTSPKVCSCMQCCPLCLGSLSEPSMRPLWWLLSEASCMDTLTQLLAFCCSADGVAWRNIGVS